MTLSFNSIIAEAKESLSFLKEMGCNDLECSERSLKIMEGWDFKRLKTESALCNKCKGRRKGKGIILGEGSYKAKLMFVGYAPGDAEEKAGKPFDDAALVPFVHVDIEFLKRLE